MRSRIFRIVAYTVAYMLLTVFLGFLGIVSYGRLKSVAGLSACLVEAIVFAIVFDVITQYLWKVDGSR